tara:strand:- start:78 stop:431 length:354 start_codon:yes stop_codon:yes gene_type:complete
MRPILIIALLLSTAANATTQISTKNAPFHEGESVIACGPLKQVSQFKRGVYLNMDERYPQQSITFVVWEDDLAEFKQQHGPLEDLVGKNICGKGTITLYKGRSQMSLYNSFALKIEN